MNQKDRLTEATIEKLLQAKNTTDIANQKVTEEKNSIDKKLKNLLVECEKVQGFSDFVKDLIDTLEPNVVKITKNGNPLDILDDLSKLNDIDTKEK